jgi:arabinofuranosyltransferase
MTGKPRPRRLSEPPSGTRPRPLSGTRPRGLSGPRPPWLSSPLAALSLVAALVFLVVYSRLWSYVLDDTYISLRFARHLAQGQGLVYNPGERVEGFSNFLWTVFLALPFAARVPVIPFLKVALALLSLAVAWAIPGLASASGVLPARPGDRWLAWAPAWLFLVTPLAIERAADGLETIPFTLLLVLATTWAFAEPQSGRFPRLGLALAALAMMRPDGVLAAPVLIAIAGFRGARPWQLLRAALAFALLLGLFLLGRHAYYGEWLPNTYFAKHGGGTAWRLGLSSLLEFLAATGGWAWLLALPALAARPTRGAAWALLAVAGTRFLFHAWSGGEWVGFRRFLTPALPFLYLLVVASVALIPSRALRPYVAALALVLLVAPAWLRYPRHEAELIAYERGLDGAQGALGRAIAARTRPDALIAMDDAGLGPYLAERRNLDMLGLNDKHIARLPGRFAYKYDTGYVLARAPDLIVLVSSVPEPTRGEQFPVAGHAALAADSTFHARYDLLRVYPMRPDYNLGVFRRRDSRAVPADF